MGAIIYWAIIRFAIVILATWALFGYFKTYAEWWTVFFLAIGVVVLYPAQIAYRKHAESQQKTEENSLCTSCRHYVHDSILCGILDEHVTPTYTPCGGDAWEPIS